MKFEHSPFVAIEVNDYEKACDYYEKVIGMELVKKHPVESHFRLGDMNYFISNAPGGKIYFEFKTDDISGAKKLLEENGCKIAQVYGEKSILFADPFGLIYHVFEE